MIHNLHLEVLIFVVVYSFKLNDYVLLLLFSHSNWMTGINEFCWALRLSCQISSFLDVRGLCAERATAPESSSRKAHCFVVSGYVSMRFVFVNGRGFCCSARTTCPTWNATHSDGRHQECPAAVKKTAFLSKKQCLPGLLCSWRSGTFMVSGRIDVRFHCWSYRLLGTTFKSLLEFKVCANI